MQETKFKSLFFNSILYFQLFSSLNIILKLNNKRELQNIAINHSAKVDYKDFVNIYRHCTNKPYSFLTINEQIKILDDKIRSNQAQYDLGRQNAKISALSSGELDKFEYLTGEDLGYKPDVVQKTKFEYSLLGQVFNKGLEKDEKQVGC